MVHVYSKLWNYLIPRVTVSDIFLVLPSQGLGFHVVLQWHSGKNMDLTQGLIPTRASDIKIYAVLVPSIILDYMFKNRYWYFPILHPYANIEKYLEANYIGRP